MSESNVDREALAAPTAGVNRSTLARLIDPAIYPDINQVTGDAWSASLRAADAVLAFLAAQPTPAPLDPDVARALFHLRAAALKSTTRGKETIDGWCDTIAAAFGAARSPGGVWTCGHCGRAAVAHNLPGSPSDGCIFEPVWKPARAAVAGGDGATEWGVDQSWAGQGIVTYPDEATARYEKGLRYDEPTTRVMVREVTPWREAQR